MVGSAGLPRSPEDYLIAMPVVVDNGRDVSAESGSGDEAVSTLLAYIRLPVLPCQDG